MEEQKCLTRVVSSLKNSNSVIQIPQKQDETCDYGSKDIDNFYTIFKQTKILG
jgi:hypothetical protein